MISPNEQTAFEAEGQMLRCPITGLQRLFKFGERVVATIEHVDAEMVVVADDCRAGYLLDATGHAIEPMKTERVVIEFTKVKPGKGVWRIVERAS